VAATISDRGAVFSLVALLVAALPAAAAPDVWRRIGPFGGSILALAASPFDPLTAYAGTKKDGVYRTTDGGARWVKQASGLTNEIVQALAADPSVPGLVFAGTPTGAFRSTDGGATFTAISSGLTETYVRAFVVTPLPRTVYAATTGGVFRSDDGGDSWHATGLTGTHVTRLALDPAAPSTLYAGTDHSGMFKSNDGGKSWDAINFGLDNPIIRSVAVDPRTTSTVYAATYGDGVYKSTNAGKSWDPANSGIELTGAECLLVDPEGVVYLGTYYQGLYKSVDGGASWAPSAVGLTDKNVITLAMNPGQPASLYAGGDGVGVFRTTNAGATWSLATAGITNQSVFAVTFAPGDADTVYTGTFGTGVYKSTDAGESWALSNTGLTNRYHRAIAVDPFDPSNVYSANSFVGGLFKSTNAGASWQLLPLGASEVLALALDPTRPGVVFAGYDGGISRSTDGGASFTQLNAGLQPEPEVRALALDPRNPDILYEGGFLGYLHKSVNGGKSWETLPLLDFNLRTVTLDPVNSSVVYVGSLQGGIFRSEDAGATWKAINNGLPTTVVDGGPPTIDVPSIAVHPLNPRIVYAAVTGNGVHRSLDAGGSWAPLNAGLDNRDVNVLTLRPGHPDTLYAGSYLSGVYRIDQTNLPMPTCLPDSRSLCLNAARFRATVAWRNPYDGTSGVGTAVAITSDTGYFWFFDAANIELVVKVLDGRPTNGKFWVFYGALSDVEYTVTVTDTVTSAVRTYHNLPHQLASVADTAAFP